ncbi:MAG: type II toxin-antitoxin system VapC family toxin [Candidatus Micrarchaeota archaeon]|nr:type II toxin-antitoxin system VapC family toxin [Candidatus Micrarchaeota archaeon]
MTDIFDSSAIYNMVCKGIPGPIGSGATISLASYETGNIIWKEHSIHKRLGFAEASGLIEIVSSVIDNMKKVGLRGLQSEILEAAAKLNISYYDASYVVAARRSGGTLVTEDKKLASKASPFIEIKTCDELLSEDLQE